MRRRAALPIAAGFVSLAAFCVLAAAGLPILGRYLLLPAALLAVFCGAGAFGWLRLPREHPWRARWAAIGAVVLARSSPSRPGQADRIADLRAAMGTQAEILADLHDISGADPLPAGRGPEPPPGPAHRAVDRHPARARSSPRSSSSRRAASTSIPPASACSATSRSTRATRSG